MKNLIRIQGTIWILYLAWNIYISKINSVERFFGGIQHCVTVVGKRIFDSNFIFEIPLTCDDLDYCWTNDKEKINKWVQRSIESHWVFNNREKYTFHPEVKIPKLCSMIEIFYKQKIMYNK